MRLGLNLGVLVLGMAMCGGFCYALDRIGYDHTLDVHPFTMIGCEGGHEVVSLESCGGHGDGIADNTIPLRRAFSALMAN